MDVVVVVEVIAIVVVVIVVVEIIAVVVVVERKGNVLFNDALNTFYLRLYGVRISNRSNSSSIGSSIS